MLESMKPSAFFPLTGCCAPCGHSGSIWQPVHHKGLCHCVCPQHNDQLCTGKNWNIIIYSILGVFVLLLLFFVCFQVYNLSQNIQEDDLQHLQVGGHFFLGNRSTNISYSNFCDLIVVLSCEAFHRIRPTGNGGNLPETFPGKGCCSWLCDHVYVYIL